MDKYLVTIQESENKIVHTWVEGFEAVQQHISVSKGKVIEVKNITWSEE
jgi:hypothetical protein